MRGTSELVFAHIRNKEIAGATRDRAPATVALVIGLRRERGGRGILGVLQSCGDGELDDGGGGGEFWRQDDPSVDLPDWASCFWTSFDVHGESNKCRSPLELFPHAVHSF